MDRIHLKSPKNWINDPNGFIYYKGQYHLFYQHFPFAPQWGRMHWGHAVSTDLVTWKHLDIALYPSKTDDRSGCFSGSAAEHNGKMHLFYTGVNYTDENPENINCMTDDNFISSQMKITSEDGLRFDNIKDKKTVIPPLRNSTYGSEKNTRDPKVWRGKKAWYMILGSTSGQKGRFLIYKSEDLENWKYAGFSEKEGFGWMWECPDYFTADNTGIVIFSPIGIKDDCRPYDSASVCVKADFNEEDCSLVLSSDYQLFDYGIDLYAPQSTEDENGRRTVIAWARMPEPTDEGWIGMMCIPRIPEIKNGHIFFRPHPSVKNAFRNKTDRFSYSTACMVKTNLKNGEYIDIGGYIIKKENDRITTDRSAVFVSGENFRTSSETPVIKEGTELEIYTDSHLIEVFINDGEYVLSSVVYGLNDSISGAEHQIYTAEQGE